MIYELFEKEGFADDYQQLSERKNFMLADEFLKLSRDAEIEPNTVIFGSVNRLHLIASKMKGNTSFQDNAECVNVKELDEWVEKNRGIAEEKEEPEPPEEEETEIEYAALDEEQKGEIEEEVIEAKEEEILPELHDTIPENPEEVKQTGRSFTFKYLAEPVRISSVASGYSIHDYNPKELAYEFIKSLGVN